MANRRYLQQHWVWIALAATCISVRAEAEAREVLIRIVGNGGNAEYREDGTSTEEPVEVRVGDTVVWRNQGNRTHTATADISDPDPLFDTGDIPRPSDDGQVSSSDPVEMTSELFER